MKKIILICSIGFLLLLADCYAGILYGNYNCVTPIPGIASPRGALPFVGKTQTSLTQYNTLCSGNFNQPRGVVPYLGTNCSGGIPIDIKQNCKLKRSSPFSGYTVCGFLGLTLYFPEYIKSATLYVNRCGAVFNYSTSYYVKYRECGECYALQ